jgi:hypothetical protein
MKSTISLITAFFLSLVVLISCTTLKDTTLKENPDFRKNAYTYQVTSPLGYRSPLFDKYLLHDTHMNADYEVEPQYEDPESIYSRLGSESAHPHAIKSSEVTTYDFVISNPLDNSSYVVIGETTFYRVTGEREGESVEEGGLATPVEFWIFQNAEEVGKITVKQPSPYSYPNLVYPIEISLHAKSVHAEYQKALNEKSISFEDAKGLLALVGLTTSGFVATKFEGEVLTRQGLTDESRADIVSVFMVTDIVMTIIESVRL